MKKQEQQPKLIDSNWFFKRNHVTGLKIVQYITMYKTHRKNGSYTLLYTVLF